MYCHYCGKELPENAVFCPHCGAAQTAHPSAAHSAAAHSDTPQTNPLCIIGFALSLFSLFILHRMLFSAAGIVLSVLGLIQARKHREKGAVFAAIGIAAGAATVIFRVIRVFLLESFAFEFLGRLFRLLDSCLVTLEEMI